MQTGRIAIGCALVALTLLSTVMPASAQGSVSWKLDCKGNGGVAASWAWLLNGAPISGASGSAYCGGTGTIARPGDANGLVVVLTVWARSDGQGKSVNMSFGPGTSINVQLSASANSPWYVPHCNPFQDCDKIHSRIYVQAHFDLDG